MAVQIPFKEAPSFIEQVTLDGSPYQLKIYWNTRSRFWTLAIFDLEDNLLLGGVKLVLGVDVLGGHPQAELPPGEIWVVDRGGGLSDPAYEDFWGDRGLLLLYAEEDDIEELEEA
jgi:hypothetical protein